MTRSPKKGRKERNKQREADQQSRAQELRQLPLPRPVSVTISGTVVSGPLPPPEILQLYDQVVSGAAQRIIAMGEREQVHRQKMETLEVVYGFAGMGGGLVVGLAGIGGAIFLASGGNWITGSVLGGATLGSLVTAFIMGRKLRPDVVLQERAPPS